MKTTDYTCYRYFLIFRRLYQVGSVLSRSELYPFFYINGIIQFKSKMDLAPVFWVNVNFSTRMRHVFFLLHLMHNIHVYFIKQCLIKIEPFITKLNLFRYVTKKCTLEKFEIGVEYEDWHYIVACLTYVLF